MIKRKIMTTVQKFDDVLFQILKLASLEAMRSQDLIKQISNAIVAAETVSGEKLTDWEMEAIILHEVQSPVNIRSDRGISLEITTTKNDKLIFIRMSGRHGEVGLERFDRVEIVIN